MFLHFFFQTNIIISQGQPTVDDDAGLAGVGGAKVVGDDALVASLVREGDSPQVQDGGVLHHASADAGHVGRGALVVSLHMGVVLRLGVSEQLLVLAPREGHGGGAAARRRAGETHVAAEDRHRGFGLCCDLWFRDVVWRKWKGKKNVREGRR